MVIIYPPTLEPATQEYVFAVFQDQFWQSDESKRDPEFVLSADSTIEEWRDIYDLLEWRQLGRAFNEMWGIDCSDKQWRDVLCPARKRRVSDVCELISKYASRPKIKPANLLGRQCAPAGAFLTIRSILHRAGVPAADITPSTPLAPYARKYCQLFLGPIAQLAPGSIPQIKVSHPAYDLGVWAVIGSSVFLLASQFMDAPLVTILAVLVLVMSWVVQWITARWVLPASVEFGSLKTFRDLAVTIADEQASKF